MQGIVADVFVVLCSAIVVISFKKCPYKFIKFQLFM